MIHQFIFAAPKPGMTEREFQDYWINQHAVRYASKIKQIVQYSVSARLPLSPDEGEPLWSGLADIWLRNDEEQLASLMSPELIDGARRDEPNWAAFWRSVVVDTEAHILKEGGGLDAVRGGVKLVALVKRRPGMTVEAFRQYAHEAHAPLGLKLPGLLRYGHYYTRDGAYTVCEPPFDGLSCLWFADEDAARAALVSEPYRQGVEADLANFLELKYLHVFLMKEHWVIGPNGYD